MMSTASCICVSVMTSGGARRILSSCVGFAISPLSRMRKHTSHASYSVQNKARSHAVGPPDLCKFRPHNHEADNIAKLNTGTGKYTATSTEVGTLAVDGCKGKGGPYSERA